MQIADLSRQTQIPARELEAARETLCRLALAYRTTPVMALRHLMGHEQDTRPYAPDGRAAAWRVRCRILDERREMLADSDPEAGPQEPGADVVTGLPGVAAWAAGLCAAFHGQADLSGPFIQRVPTLRVTLARNKSGAGVWAVPYDVGGRAYVARVDVVKMPA